MIPGKATWARHKVGDAIRTGKLTRPACCSNCGAPDWPMKDGRSSIQAHHHMGYDKPLEVEWLCVLCHNKITPQPWGEAAGAAKLNWELVDEIRARYRNGESCPSMAHQLGMSHSAVHRIVTHRTWREHTRPALVRSAIAPGAG